MKTTAAAAGMLFKTNDGWLSTVSLIFNSDSILFHLWEFTQIHLKLQDLNCATSSLTPITELGFCGPLDNVMLRLV